MGPREMWACSHCTAEYTSAWAAAVCCDEAAFGDED